MEQLLDRQSTLIEPCSLQLVNFVDIFIGFDVNQNVNVRSIAALSIIIIIIIIINRFV